MTGVQTCALPIWPALQALLWFVPTALFGRFRDSEPRSTDAAAFHDVLTQAGFELLEAKQTFLAGINLLAGGASLRQPRPTRAGRGRGEP